MAYTRIPNHPNPSSIEEAQAYLAADKQALADVKAAAERDGTAHHIAGGSVVYDLEPSFGAYAYGGDLLVNWA